MLFLDMVYIEMKKIIFNLLTKNVRFSIYIVFCKINVDSMKIQSKSNDESESWNSSDESKNDTNRKRRSGFNRKRRKDIGFKPKKNAVFSLQKISLLP